MKDIIEKYVDKEGSVTLNGTNRINGIAFNVRILDYKEAYGKKRWLVAPLSGKGTAWVEQDPIHPEPIVIEDDK